MKKQTRNFIILGIVVVLVIGAYVGIQLWNKAQAEKEAQAAENSKVYVSQLVDAVEIAYSNGEEEYTFARNEDGEWYYVPAPGFPLDDSNLRKIEEEVMGLEAVYSVDLTDDLSYYGLDSGKTLKVTDSNGQVLDMIIGTRSSDQESYYVMLAGGDTCFTIDGDLNRYTNKTLMEMAVLPGRLDLDEELLVSVTIEGKFGSMTLDKEITTVESESGEGPVTEYVWYITTDEVERKTLKTFDITVDLASYSSTAKYLEAILNDDMTYMSVDYGFVYQPTEEELAEMGLLEPKYVITVVYETDEMLDDGTYATETVTFEVGEYSSLYDEDGAEIASTMLRRYTRIVGDDLIYLMAEDDYEKLELTYFEFYGHSIEEEPVGVATLAQDEPSEDAAEEPETADVPETEDAPETEDEG